MNERIKELMAQAGFDPAAIKRMGVMPNAEKFAELIVKECVWQVVKDNAVPHNIQVLIGERFEKHFGVEE